MKSIFITLFCIITFFAQAQETYFQQEVNYTIQATLDDQNHQLAADIQIEYTNNSPQTLHKIYMHLWPNAYSHGNTAFAKQQLAHNKNKFYFAKDEDLGSMTELDFKVDGRSVSWKPIHPDTPDIAIITLQQPLRPNQTISIQTPFHVKIPASFSRLGHDESSYQMTQWYPKPAVYDHKGWHPMPYLDQGEFYSEFGSFDVSITLPQNYIVGATGQLLTDSEKLFINNKITQTKEKLNTDNLSNSFPASAKKMKTIRYTAQNVHDFAWFADKRFLVTTDTLQLASGKVIDVYAMFTPKSQKNWAEATDYIKRSLKSYSNWVGEYPYPQATAVHSALSAGGGMEYPMITVIGKTHSKKSTDEVITHEVGHNWFYGILASNERDHAWMDEGMNSFYEAKYMKQFYPVEKRKKNKFSNHQLLYSIFSRRHEAANINDPVGEMSELNVGLTAYSKPALSLKMLEAFVGKSTFERTMKEYYQTCKFKHPYPDDFKDIWTKNTDKNLDWFFEDVLTTTKTMDYKPLKIKVKENKYELEITNKGALKGPLLLYGIKNNGQVDSIIIDGFTGTKTISFDKPPNGRTYDAFEIDRNNNTLDLHPQNNTFGGAKVKGRPGFGIEDTKTNYLFWLPAYGWNAYDKNMLGVAFYNEGFLKQKSFFSITPMYSFGAKTVVGTAEFQYPIYANGIIRKITPRLSVRRFSYYNNTRDDYAQTYTRVVPSIRLNLRGKKNKQTIWLNHELVQTDQPVFENGQFNHLDKNLNQYSTVHHRFVRQRAISEFSLDSHLEYAKYDNFDLGEKQYLKLRIGTHSNFYYQPKKKISLQFHGSYFLQNDARYSSSFNNGLVLGSLSTTGNGRDDYAFRSLYFGRSENSGIWGQQIHHKEATMKHPILNSPYGHSNDWMVGFNFLADIPFKLPTGITAKPYFDVALFGAPDTPNSTQTKNMYSGGIQLGLVGFITVNFPIINNKALNDLLLQRKDGNYFGRVTFNIDLNSISSPSSIQESVLNSF